MERGNWEDAMHAVLGNPDLLALILEKLPTPQLIFDAGACRMTDRDRWAASHVNAAFRRAALSLPWAAVKRGHFDLDSQMAALLRSRSVRSWTLALTPGETCTQAELKRNLKSAAALLHCAPATEHLSVHSTWAGAVHEWLRYSRAPPSGSASGGPEVDTTVLAGLASLSRLTSLLVECPHLYDASWLGVLSRLQGLTLVGYQGVPVGALPALESLHVQGNTQRSTLLGEWASPRLTALSLDECCLDLGRPLSSPSAQRQGTEAPEARGWLSSLQRLELGTCEWGCLSPGLRKLMPGLTYLSFEHQDAVTHGTLGPLLRKGLPLGLKCLHLCGRSPLWAPLFALTDLVSLEVEQFNIMTVDTTAAVVAGLTGLPALKHVRFNLPVRDEAGVREGFTTLAALLLSRGGGLHLSFCIYPKL